MLVLAGGLHEHGGMKPTTIVTVLAAASLLSAGCVSKGKYDEAVSQTELTRAELAKRDQALAKRNADLMVSNADLDARAREIARLRNELYVLERASNVDRSRTGARIAELAKRLGELEAAQSAAEARAAFYREISLRLKEQIDSGDLDVVVRDGRMVLRLPNDVLFDTGRTELKPAGKQALGAIAKVLAMYPQRQFQVAGHTDDVPIHNDRFASNWELSSGRALRVLHFLVEKGASPESLSAAGYGEVDPIATNASADGKKKNRRTEITLQPTIDEMVHVP